MPVFSFSWDEFSIMPEEEKKVKQKTEKI